MGRERRRLLVVLHGPAEDLEVSIRLADPADGTSLDGLLVRATAP